jgi:hypothetical protein
MWWGVSAALLANVLHSTRSVLEKRPLAALPEVGVRRPARLLALVLRNPLRLGGCPVTTPTRTPHPPIRS